MPPRERERERESWNIGLLILMGPYNFKAFEQKFC
jgi:hypothetical protein